MSKQAKIMSVLGAIILVGACPVRADLVFDSGYNTFDANDPYYDEVVVINDAHLDVLGGTMWKLELNDYATANIYSGDMDLLFTNENSVANIHNGTIGCFGAYDNSVVNLYAYDVVFHPVDEYGESWIEGRYYSNNNSFTLGVWHRDHYSHVNIVPEPVVDAEIDIDPDTVNLKSKGKWISCKIWLPEDYNAADVNSASVRLQGQVPADWLWFNEKQNVIMAKFKRSEIAEILEPGDVELTVAGYLMDGSYFVGTDTIKVIDKGRLRGRRVNSNSKVVDGIEYYIQTDKSLYRLGEHVEMLYRVTNLTDVSVNLGTLLPDPPDNYDLRIMQGNAQVWWYPYTAITAVIRDFILQPLETKEFQTTWDMMNDNGTPFQEYDDFFVTPGSYNVVGEVALSFGYERVPVSVSIEIIPGKKKR